MKRRGFNRFHLPVKSAHSAVFCLTSLPLTSFNLKLIKWFHYCAAEVFEPHRFAVAT